MNIRRAHLDHSYAIGRVQLDSWRSAYVGILPDAYLASFTHEQRGEDWIELLSTDPEQVVFVAETETGEIVGFVCGLPDRNDIGKYECEISALHILPTYRRQGIGHKLIAAVARELKAHGFTSLYLWVLKENRPARSFYEKLGGQLFGEKQTPLDEEGTEFAIDVAYGWPELNTLCELT
jgi:ribosomal protein S18 acetylase RimI-like enzyme